MASPSTGTPWRIFGVGGSLRRASFNRSLLRAAGEVLPTTVDFDVFDGLGAIPHFSQELEGERTPAAVLELRDRISRAQAVLVCTPEYNGSMPGVLKNGLDWASRPPGESVLAGKPAAVVGASPGRYGAVRAQADVRKVLTAVGAIVLDAELPVPRAHEKFDGKGALLDEAVRGELHSLVASLLELAGASSASGIGRIQPDVPAGHCTARWARSPRVARDGLTPTPLLR